MRQPLPGGARGSELRRAALPVRTRNGIPRAGRGSRAEVGQASSQLGGRLDPDLVDPSLRPRREEAHAVTAREDVGQVVVDARPGQVLEDVLSELERGYDVERDADDQAQRPEAYDRAVELVVATAKPAERAVGADEVECR